MAWIKTGDAFLQASSAPRFMLSNASSTSLPIPSFRKVVSIFLASGGINILTAALAKKPSGLDKRDAPFSVPTTNASFKPAIISSLPNDFPLVAVTASFALFNKPFNPCAFMGI